MGKDGRLAGRGRHNGVRCNDGGYATAGVAPNPLGAHRQQRKTRPSPRAPPKTPRPRDGTTRHGRQATHHAGCSPGGGVLPGTRPARGGTRRHPGAPARSHTRRGRDDACPGRSPPRCLLARLHPCPHLAKEISTAGTVHVVPLPDQRSTPHAPAPLPVGGPCCGISQWNAPGAPQIFLPPRCVT